MDSETVVRLRAAGTKTDRFGGTEVLDWSLPPLELALTTLAPAEPRPSSEPVEAARNAVVAGWTIYLDRTADVTAQDRMRVRGETYEVLGDPADWLGAGIIVQLGGSTG